MKEIFRILVYLLIVFLIFSNPVGFVLGIIFLIINLFIPKKYRMDKIVNSIVDYFYSN